MAHLSGTAGRVTAIEFDATLAGRAALNFSNAGNVQVHEGGGFSMPFEKADVIYVNAGATHPANNWLDQLNDGGRLILPHTAKKTLPPGGAGSITRRGAVFRIERNGVEYLANWVSAVGVYRCEGGRDDAAEAALDAALQKGSWQAVTRLYRTDSLSADRCWLRGRGWALAYE